MLIRLNKNIEVNKAQDPPKLALAVEQPSKKLTE